MEVLEIRKLPTPTGTRITLEGIIDESSDLSPLDDLRGSVEVNMRGVRRINSFGARAWMDAVRQAQDKATLRFVECPPVVIDQLNMILGFLGQGRVESFLAPMVCESCSHEETHKFDARACRDNNGHLVPVDCPRCGSLLELDDLEDQYTLFLREPTFVS